MAGADSNLPPLSSKAQVSVNGKKYKDGEYKINNKKGKPIYFDSSEGSLIVQDLKKGKLSLEILDI